MSPKFFLPRSVSGNTSNKTLLFLHGFLGNKEEWSYFAESLQDRCQIVAVDLPGHGDALFDDGLLYKMEACAEQLMKLLKFLDVGKANLVGYSMGGRLGLYLGIRYPQVFEKVLLISSSPGLEDAQERERRAAADFSLARALEQQEMGDFLKKWYDADLFRSLKNQPELLRDVIEKRKQNSPRHLAMSLDHMGTGVQESLWPHLAKIKFKLDLAVGEYDAKFIAIAEKMRGYNLEGIEMHMIKEAGHALHVEKQAAFCKFLEAWLALPA